ncbi:MAG: hypothetical protein ACLSVD_02840 [Eggerthellaceae bacterium]
MTLAAREDCKPYVPYLDGHLRARRRPRACRRTGCSSGATRQCVRQGEYCGLPKRWPGTCMQWFDPAKAANISKWIRIAGTKAGGVANGR